MKVKVQVKYLSVLVLLCAAAGVIHSQEFKVFDRTVQVHGFVSQGFGYTSQNNWLTMNTSKGSVAMTEGALNMSMPVTDKFRIAGQVYSRNIGNLGQWHPQLDWAVADYKFSKYFGVRGGKVKTTFGLYNDTQDMNFLHTSAVLPQSIYPLDLRDGLLAHIGGDVYGTIASKKLGSFSYTGFAGLRKDGLYGGYIYLLQNAGINMKEYGGLQWGGDLRWNTPLKGLMVGYSGMNQDITGKGTSTTFGPRSYYVENSKKDQANQFYGQYTAGKFRIDAEYRRWWRDQIIYNGIGEIKTDTRGWYTAAAYRFTKWMELGGYYSRQTNSWTTDLGLSQSPDQSAADRHVYDKTISARFDIKSYWNVKIEGHFMDGYLNSMYPGGFYEVDNPQGLQRKTNALVIKTGFNF